MHYYKLDSLNPPTFSIPPLHRPETWVCSGKFSAQDLRKSQSRCPPGWTLEALKNNPLPTFLGFWPNSIVNSIISS